MTEVERIVNIESKRKRIGEAIMQRKTVERIRMKDGTCKKECEIEEFSS